MGRSGHGEHVGRVAVALMFLSTSSSATSGLSSCACVVCVVHHNGFPKGENMVVRSWRVHSGEHGRAVSGAHHASEVDRMVVQ